MTAAPPSGLWWSRHVHTKEQKMTIDKRAVRGMAAAAGILAAAAAEAGKPDSRTMTLTTKSPAAREQLVELQRRIESFQFAGNEELAKKIVAADPEFAM